jgi:small subunit ribosomal protein S2
VIAIVDTNCDPDPIDLVIPGNDDAIRTAYLVADVMAQAAKDGVETREAARKDAPAKDAPAKGAKPKPEPTPKPSVEAVVLDEIQAENAVVESVVIEETPNPKEAS